MRINKLTYFEFCCLFMGKRFYNVKTGNDLGKQEVYTLYSQGSLRLDHLETNVPICPVHHRDKIGWRGGILITSRP